MDEAKVELEAEDFCATARADAPRASLERVWAAYELEPRWTRACAAIAADSEELDAAAQRLRTQLARFLSMRSEDWPAAEPPTASNEDAAVFRERLAICLHAVAALAAERPPRPPAVPAGLRQAQFLAVGLRYLLPLAAGSSETRCAPLLSDMAVRYHAVAYHHVGHATLVLHHAVELAQHCGLWTVLAGPERLAFALAAAGHDLGHPGLGSSLLLKASHPLALIYNERHVLENYHAAVLTALLQKHEWAPIDRTRGGVSAGEIRALIVQCILWTDIADHARIMGAANETLARLRRGGRRGSALRQQLAAEKPALRDVAAVVLKAADLSYLALADPVDMVEWAAAYYAELYAQRRLEAAHELPLCEPHGVHALGTRKWFESNLTFCTQVLMPIADFLAHFEVRLLGPYAVDDEQPIEQRTAALTSAQLPVRQLQAARETHGSWPATAQALLELDSAAAAQSHGPEPADSATKKVARWLVRQSSLLRKNALGPAPTAAHHTRIWQALALPLQRNIEILKQARYA